MKMETFILKEIAKAEVQEFSMHNRVIALQRELIKFRKVLKGCAIKDKC